MTQDFSEKIALITGGGSGLGRQSALDFAKRGATVALSDVNVAGGEETVAMIEEKGGTAVFTEMNVTDQAAVTAWVDGVVGQFGRLDFALNNAGVGGSTGYRTAEISEDLWHHVIDVNLNGVWYCMKAQLPHMVKQGHGCIVNLASIAGLVAVPRNAAYAASKHAVVGLTRSAALEYVRKGIRINAVCPGFTDTPMVQGGMEADPVFAQRLLQGVPARRLGLPEEISAAVMYLCSDEADFMIGQTMILDGGITAG